MDMTDKRLADIEARAEAATPGPWRASTGRTYDPSTGRVTSVEHWISRGDDDVGITGDVSDSRTGTPSEPTALFIAHARTDVPDLIAEVRRLRAVIAGRTTPPTDAEIREHAERGGAWLVTLPPRAQVRMMPETRYTSDPVEVSRLWWSEGAWWVPVRYGRPCSWPTAEVPRG